MPRGPAHASERGAPHDLIPKRFLVPWEFEKPRDEVLYDMGSDFGLRAWAGSVVRRLKSRFGRGRRMQRWQALLTGKSPEDQLWGVRPPRYGFDDPVVLDWAERTLAACGLDPSVMLDEWEIYWRRKGVEA